MVNAASKITAITLVAGGSYIEREAWITTALQHLTLQEYQQKSGVLLEGLPAGIMLLQTSTLLSVERIAPGCFCCIGQLAMRVSLNRLLRQKLGHLFIAINDAQHLTLLQSSLNQPPYAALATCENVITLQEE